MPNATPMIPLVRPIIGEEEIEAAVRVLRSGQLAQGPETSAFEAEFADFIGVKHAVAVNSGTAAIHAALAAAGVQSGDEVITTPFTFAATATPILMQGARPVFVDIEAATFNADLERLAEAVTPRTKAVIAVDLFGQPVDIRAMDRLRSKSVAVIEDACQAIGASRGGIRAGALMDAGCFSLYATKNIMTGEGGMLTTDSDAIADSARRFRQHGQGARYEYLELGYNYRMTDVLAAIGRVQLKRTENITARRQQNASQYTDRLTGIQGVTVPYVAPTVQHAYHQYTIRIDSSKTRNGANRDAVRSFMDKLGVSTGVYYPTPLHLNPLFSRFSDGVGSFPNAELCASQVLALPVHPGIDEAAVGRVCDAIRDAVNAQ